MAFSILWQKLWVAECLTSRYPMQVEEKIGMSATLSGVYSVLGAVLVLCFLVVVHEFGHFIVARLCGMRVDKFSIGFGPTLWKKQWGETTFQICPILLGGYVQIAGLNPDEEGDKKTDPADPRLFPNKPVWQRFLAVLAGPAINYIFAALMFVGLNIAVGVPTEVAGVAIHGVVKGQSAQKAGLQPGDKVLRLNETPVENVDQLTTLIQKTEGALAKWVVSRAGTTLEVDLAAERDAGTWRAGVALGPVVERRPASLLTSVKEGVLYPVYFTVDNLRKLFKSPDQASGPVGIIRMVKSGFAKGLVDSLFLMGMISVALGMFNLFPLPALDGGRLVFLAIEAVTRRRVSHRVEQWVHAVGFLLLLGLILLLTVKDVVGLFRK